MNIITEKDLEKFMELGSIDINATVWLLSSGMSINDIPNLKFSDFINSIYRYLGEVQNPLNINELNMKLIDRGEVAGTWCIPSLENNISYINFTRPECTTAILKHLKNREQEDGKIYYNDPVFLKPSNGFSINKLYLKTAIYNTGMLVGKHFTPVNLQKFYIKVLNERGVY